LRHAETSQPYLLFRAAAAGRRVTSQEQSMIEAGEEGDFQAWLISIGADWDE
jgi:hypothetical protein